MQIRISFLLVLGVCYGKHSGTKLFYKGVRMILLFDDQINMRVEDPKDLDPTFNLGNH